MSKIGIAKPVVCIECGQRGDEPPGLRIVGGLPEAVFVDDGAIAVEHIECRKCGHTVPIAAGSVEVRQPPKRGKRAKGN